MSNYKQGGYEKKYIIQKASGKPVDPDAEYFVLRLDKDPYALDALYGYAVSLMFVNPELHKDLMDVIRKNRNIQTEKGIETMPRGPLRT